MLLEEYATATNQLAGNGSASDELYLAGDDVPGGLYEDIDSGRTVQLSERGRLPASFNGRVSSYRQLDNLWSQICPELSK